MTTLLRTEKLSIYKKQRCLIKQFNFQLQRGEMWGLLGANGSGKTSLLHCLAGLEQQQGQILLNNHNITQHKRRHLAQQLALLLQNYPHFFPSTVTELVASGRFARQNLWQGENQQDKIIIQHALAALKLEPLQDHHVETLSGGEQRRAEIAMLLAQQAKIYLLDEPTNHLDSHYQHIVFEHFQQLAKQQGCGIIIATHHLHLAQQYCDKFIVLQPEGKYRLSTCEEIANVTI